VDKNATVALFRHKTGIYLPMIQILYNIVNVI